MCLSQYICGNAKDKNLEKVLPYKRKHWLAYFAYNVKVQKLKCNPDTNLIHALESHIF